MHRKPMIHLVLENGDLEHCTTLAFCEANWNNCRAYKASSYNHPDSGIRNSWRLLSMTIDEFIILGGGLLAVGIGFFVVLLWLGI